MLRSRALACGLLLAEGRIPGIASSAPVIADQPEPLPATDTRPVEAAVPAMAPRTDALRRPAPAGHTAAAGDVQPATADPAEQRVSAMMAALGGVTGRREPPVNTGRPDNWRPAVHRPQTKPRRGLGLLGWLIFGETLTPIQAVGGALVLAAVVLAQRSAQTKTGAGNAPAPAS